MKFFSLIIIVAFISTAHAGVTIEPFYDSMFSDSTREKNAPAGVTESTWENGGYAHGARLFATMKFQKQMTLFGFQGMLSKTSWNLTEPTSEVDALDDASIGTKDKWRGKHLGVIVGHSTKIYNSWISAMHTEFKNRNDDGTFDKNDELFGTTLEVGVGLKLISWLKVNFTFRNHKISKYRDASQRTSHTLPSIERSYGDFDIKEYYAGVSLPITFGKSK